MSKTRNYDSHIPAHLEDEVLITYLDGVLSEEEKTAVGKHLEGCWACRGNLKAIQDSIENFMNQRQEILMPPEIPPSEPALKIFQKRLQDYQTQTRHTPVFNFSKLKSKFGFLNFQTFFAPLKSLNRPMPLRIGIGALAALLIAVLIINQSSVQVVSAAELLKNSENARENSLTTVSEPVIYQKLRVNRSKNNQTDEINWETWEDANRNNFRQAVDKNGVRQLIAGKFENHSAKVSYISENERPLVLTELARILEFNGMNPNNPLLANSFKIWRASLAEKTEAVSKTNLEDGAEGYQLSVKPLGEIGNNQILTADFTVRASDWKPLKLRLEIKQESETLSFEIAQKFSEVVAFNRLPPGIFPPLQIAKTTDLQTSPKENPSLVPSPDSELIANANTNSAANVKTENAPSRVPASAELEVEVLNQLNQVKADMGEQIEVKRTTDGFLVVSGIVENAPRKAEILDSLSSVANNPSVKIEIYTVSEAVAKRKQENKTTDSAVTEVERIEVENQTIAAEPQLREYFEREGANTDEKVRRFAASRVAQSRQAMQHAGALKKLANQFTPEEFKTLKPEAREKWLALVRSHARAFEGQNAALRRELKPVFFAGASDNLSGSANISNDLELIGNIRRLYQDGAANDSVIRRAFTTSGGANFSAIGAPQFWQSLKDAESLAQKIQDYR